MTTPTPAAITQAELDELAAAEAAMWGAVGYAEYSLAEHAFVTMLKVHGRALIAAARAGIEAGAEFVRLNNEKMDHFEARIAAEARVRELTEAAAEREDLLTRLCWAQDRIKSLEEGLRKLDAFWTEGHPAGPDDPSWCNGLGVLTDETLDIWRTARALLAQSDQKPEPAPPGADGEG